MQLRRLAATALIAAGAAGSLAVAEPAGAETCRTCAISRVGLGTLGIDDPFEVLRRTTYDWGYRTESSVHQAKTHRDAGSYARSYDGTYLYASELESSRVVWTGRSFATERTYRVTQSLA